MANTRFSFEGIGTHWQIDIHDAISREKEEILLEQIKNRIELFDQAYSRFKKDSLVTAMSQKPGLYTIPVDAEPLFVIYKKLYTLTGGAFTPLIGQVLADAGYDTTYSLISKEIKTPPTWDDVMEYNFPTLHMKKPVILDFGAAGKGYLVDIVTEILRKHNLKSFCVDGSGDIFYSTQTKEAMKIGLEHPDDITSVIGVANIQNQSICGSAGNRRAWGNYHHIIDPRTLTSPRNILATWVIADTAMLADALTTCLFFVPGAQLLPEFTFHYVILFADYSIEASKDFPGEFFLVGE